MTSPARWRRFLRYDPIAPLLRSNDALRYFVRRDLLEENVGPLDTLWGLPEVLKLIKRQRKNGSWKYHGGKKHIRSRANYDQLETYRILGQLAEKYGLTRKHQAIERAADFLFSFQTTEGDFRGIYAQQYSPNYSAGIMELLIKAGFAEDARIEQGLQWLLSMRQDAGGWIIPIRSRRDSTLKLLRLRTPVQPDRSLPFSHLATGVVLRAFAAHPRYRKRADVKDAGELLKSRFFKPDKYPDRRTASFWTKIRYPFWFTDILSALDSLSWLGFSVNDVHIAEGVEWLVLHQQNTGLWKASYEMKDREIDLWTSLAVCRVLKRFTEAQPR